MGRDILIEACPRDIKRTDKDIKTRGEFSGVRREKRIGSIPLKREVPTVTRETTI